MKLGPVTKIDKRNTATSNKFDDDVISVNFNVIVILTIMVNLEQSGIRSPGAWSVKLTFSLIVTFYLKQSENRTKKSEHGSHTITLSKGTIFAKKY